MQHVRVGGPNATQGGLDTHKRVEAIDGITPAAMGTTAAAAPAAPVLPDHRPVPIAVLGELRAALFDAPPGRSSTDTLRLCMELIGPWL